MLYYIKCYSSAVLVIYIVQTIIQMPSGASIASRQYLDERPPFSLCVLLLSPPPCLLKIGSEQH